LFRPTTGDDRYVGEGGLATVITGNASTAVVTAGDALTGFIDGTTYSVVWVPTNEVLGSFSV
jgi:hypothetical protein